MKSVLEVCLVVAALICLSAAQNPEKPVLRQGVSVEMPVASHATEMRAADKEDATVVSVTADGKVFVGVKPVGITALASLNSGTVYVKADARAQYQNILKVLDALHGRSVVLLTASTVKVEKGKLIPPYGLEVSVGGQ